MSRFYRLCPIDAHTCSERECLKDEFAACPKATPEKTEGQSVVAAVEKLMAVHVAGYNIYNELVSEIIGHRVYHQCDDSATCVNSADDGDKIRIVGNRLIIKNGVLYRDDCTLPHCPSSTCEGCGAEMDAAGQPI